MTVSEMKKITKDDSAKSTKELVQKFLQVGVQKNLWRRGDRFLFYCKGQLFPGVDFRDKAMLDIGCGDGLYMVWAAVNGASSVVGLEPLADGSGSSKRVKHILHEITDAMDFHNIERHACTFQEFECEDDTFDILLMHASINHLDEKMCIELQSNPEAQLIYIQMFRKMRRIMRKHGKIIIVDASNRNVYGDLGFKKNLVNPRLRWHNHQTPQFWAKMLRNAGFGRPKISWLSNSHLGPLGVFLRNKPLAYFLESAFRLEMTAI